MTSLAYNKVCEFEDFADPELAETIRDVFRHEIPFFTPAFPTGAEYRKYWEVGMSVRALRNQGALRPDATLLGVGAGTETTIFYLTNHARQVFATDLYLSAGVWGESAPGFMLVSPDRFAPFDYHRERLVVQNMDGRYLWYADNTFDGIFSSGSIEHFGSFQSIASSAYEMGRVLKPGGILTLSTEYLIDGPPGGEGWDGLRFFSRDALQRYIVDASGLEAIDTFQTSLSPKTLASKYQQDLYARDADALLAKHGGFPRVGEIIWSHYPHLVLTDRGYVYGSVHLTLCKPQQYPLAPNEWAKPSQAIIDQAKALESSAIKLFKGNRAKELANRPVRALKKRVRKALRPS